MKKSQYPMSISWMLWGIASLFYAYQYIIRVVPSILLGPLTEKFSINAYDFGQFSGFYYLGYAGCHIPLGILLDRWGSRRTMILCLVLIIGGTLPLIASPYWVLALIGRMAVGIGSSGAILSAFQLINHYFDKKDFSRMLGGCVTIGVLGAIYGGRPFQQLIVYFGWEFSVKILLFLGLCLIGLILILVPSVAIKKHQTNIRQELKEIIRNPYVLKICLYAGCMVGPMEGFADVWAKVYLEKIYGLTAEQAAFLPSLIFLGMCIGAPLLGSLVEKVGGYYKLLIASGFIMFVIFVAILLGMGNTALLSVGFISLGIFSAYQILAIFKATTYVRQELIGITTAWSNMMIMVFGYLFHSSISLMIHYFWDGTMITNPDTLRMVPLYNATAYQAGLTIIPVGLLCGAMGFLRLYRQEKKKG